ncbi:hypothetical protein DL89DRAFT_296485 [Linderina pennispora]|uniref:Uncharacterized protein n=1 Tax=Linderina pennispora TaxID=61395 RepID=A0A1Y1VV39_9FUNG|nr:uncharacterized protein DL89DRAFT_296485 [Linderina pennispora]ORX65159.1 hypothetical protein DL89DRAFT_296485 [Linderina pennispora]
MANYVPLVASGNAPNQLATANDPAATSVPTAQHPHHGGAAAQTPQTAATANAVAPRPAGFSPDLQPVQLLAAVVPDEEWAALGITSGGHADHVAAVPGTAPPRRQLSYAEAVGGHKRPRAPRGRSTGQGASQGPPAPRRPSRQMEAEKAEYAPLLNSATIYVPIASTNPDRATLIENQVFAALGRPTVPPSHRNYPIFSFTRTAEKIGVTLMSLDDAITIAKHPFRLGNQELQWTSAMGVIHHVAIAHVPATLPYRIRAALRPYGQVSHLEPVLINQRHYGDWEFLLHVPNGKTLPASFKMHKHPLPIPLLRGDYATMACPRCKEINPEQCHCPGPQCHRAHSQRHSANHNNQAEALVAATPAAQTHEPSPDLDVQMSEHAIAQSADQPRNSNGRPVSISPAILMAEASPNAQMASLPTTPSTQQAPSMPTRATPPEGLVDFLPYGPQLPHSTSVPTTASEFERILYEDDHSSAASFSSQSVCSYSEQFGFEDDEDSEQPYAAPAEPLPEGLQIIEDSASDSSDAPLSRRLRSHTKKARHTSPQLDKQGAASAH